MSNGPILVNGATGKQGGAVLRHLLERGAEVHALTRSPYSAKAQALTALGAKVVGGDLDDPVSIKRALDDVVSVFSVQDPWANGGPAELRQGKMLADLAKAAGIRRFVQASVAAADQPTGLPHFESKGAIERHLEGLGLDVIALRPVLFMNSLLERHERQAPYILELLRRGLKGRSVQLICTDDIGRCAAEALLERRPERPGLRAIELAGDELTFPEIIRIHEQVMSSRPKVVRLPMAIIHLMARKPYSSYH